MDPEHVIQSVVNNQPKVGWAIFKFHKIRSILIFIVKAFFVLMFGTGAFILLKNSSYETDTYTFVMGCFIAACALIALIVFLFHLRSMFYMSNNMIVLTEDAIVRSWCGKIKEYKYEAIEDLRLVRIHGRSRPYPMFPEHYIEFRDVSTGNIVELARNRVFGRADIIFRVLQNKVTD